MTGVNILIGLAVLALILYRQLQPRPLRDNMRLPLILARRTSAVPCAAPLGD